MLPAFSSVVKRIYEFWYAPPSVPDVQCPPSHPLHEREHTDFFNGFRGDILNGKYQLLVKLGGGMYSTTWLASRVDGKEPRYVAAKLLSRDATKDVRNGIMQELDALKTLRDHGDFAGLPVLQDHFDFFDSAHICLVMNVLGSDVGSLRRSAPGKALPIHVVRVIMRQVVAAVAHLHKCGIVHTDIKPDNVLFHTSMSAQDIDNWLANVGDDNDNANPLPNNWTHNCTAEEAELIKVSLVDLGQCQWAGRSPTVDQFSAFSLRAPEAIIQSHFGPELDIWAIGCIIFEMLVGRWLFHPVDGSPDWTMEDDHLAKMMELTGERFSEPMLARAAKRDEFFDNRGNLLRVDELCPVPIEDALSNYKILAEGDVEPAANFIRYCCRLDPDDRPTAEQVASHAWFSKVIP